MSRTAPFDAPHSTWNRFILALATVGDRSDGRWLARLGAFHSQYGLGLVRMPAGSLLTIVVFIAFQKHFSAALFRGSVTDE